MATFSGKNGHVLAVPIPGQGHVKPLMSLCRHIAKHGIKVTFVNIQSVHERLLSAAAAEDDDATVVLASVPDGVIPGDDPFLLLETLPRTMPRTLPDLIERINCANPNEKISCVIADISFGWILDIVNDMGIEAVGFSPPSIATLALELRIPILLQQGYLDSNGSLAKIDLVKLSEEIPLWIKDKMAWSFPSDLRAQKLIFDNMKLSQEASKKAKWLLCNSCHELEPAASQLHTKFLPIGPLHLLEEANSDKSCSDHSNFYPEDASCLNWLDTKPTESVVYVSFGSSAAYSQQQLDELALGLELSGRAFLWVVRRDLANGTRATFPDGFLERTREFGKIVEWAPQNKVLSDPSVACFVSHCGWNSSLEGASKGVPYLCWPYFAEQAHNESYICDKWEIGLRIDCDENGIRSKYEIKKKIDMLFSDYNKFKANALKLKEVCAKSVSKEGTSYKNLETFIDYIRKCEI